MDNDMQGFNVNKQSLSESLTDKDPDLKCPVHDAMSLSLSNETSLKKIIYSCNYFLEQDIYFCGFNEVKIEHPVSKGTGKFYKLIGFIDCFCSIKAESRDENYGTRRIIKSIIIEAKPVIHNPMEVLRQIKTYKEYLLKSDALLWCPTIIDEYIELFEKQGVYVSKISVDEL